VLGVEDRQERDRHQCRGDEPDAALVEPGAGPVDEADDERADQRHDDARGLERGLPQLAHAADLVDRVQQVRQRRRVLVVAGVETAAVDHVECLRDEVLGLVGVVRERQPVADVPEPQAERHEQDPAQHEQRRAAGEHGRRSGRGRRRRRRCLGAHDPASRGP
jgi:hypothetical protein